MATRTSSLPPLHGRPPVPSEGPDKGPFVPAASFRRARYGGDRLWVPKQQLEPLRKDWRARSQDLFCCPSLPSIGPRGHFSSVESTAGTATGSRGGRRTPHSAPSSDQAATVLERSASRESRSHPRRRRHQEAHIRTIKAVYLGDGRTSDTPEDADTLIDELLDRPGGAVLEDPSSAEVRFRRELAGLQTGEDAIKFFTKYGGASEVKVLYCNRPPAGSEGGQTPASLPGPYDLVVVDKERVDPEHFTITDSGVLHIRPGQLSEFTALAEWMHQFLLYRVLSSMALFRLHPKRKLLAQWRQSARYSAYCQRRQQVAQRSFLAKPAYVGTMVKAQSMVSQIEQVRLLLFPEQCCQLNEFVDSQRLFLTHPTQGIHRHLEVQHDAILQLLEHQIAAVVRTAESRQGSRGMSSSRPLSVPSVAGRSRSKSMGQEKQEAREMARLNQAAHQDKLMLGDFVRVVDCMLQATLASAAVRTAVEFRKRVEAPCDQPKGALFSVGPAFGQNGEVMLQPPAEDFSRALLNLWDGIVSAAESVPTLAVALPRAGRQWCRRTLREVLDGISLWRASTAGSQDTLEELLASAGGYAREAYSAYFRIHTFTQGWNSDAFMEKDHSKEALSEDMQRMVEFETDLQRFRVHRVIGAVLLDGRALRDRLQPMPQNALVTMKSAAIRLARERCSSAARRLDVMIKGLDERPTGAAALAAYQRLSEEVALELERWPKAVEDVGEVHALLRAHGARVSADDEVQLDLFQEKVRRLSKAAQDALSFLELRQASVVSAASPMPAIDDGDVLSTPSTPSSMREAATEGKAEEKNETEGEQPAYGQLEAGPREDFDVTCGLSLTSSGPPPPPLDEGAAAEQDQLSTTEEARACVRSLSLTSSLHGEELEGVDSTTIAEEACRPIRTVRFATSPGGGVAFEELGTPTAGV